MPEPTPFRPPPGFDHWPQALRSAALHEGTLRRCGPGTRAAAWPESPGVRLTAIARVLTQTRAAAGQTAAWVWGCCRSPGSPLTLIATRGRAPHGLVRAAALDTPARVREFRLREGDIVRVAGRAVTGHVRTCFDLLRDPAPLTPARRAAVRLLLAHASHEHRTAAPLSGRCGPVERLAARARETNRAEGARALRRLAALGYDPG